MMNVWRDRVQQNVIHVYIKLILELNRYVVQKVVNMTRKMKNVYDVTIKGLSLVVLGFFEVLKLRYFFFALLIKPV